MSVTAVRNCDRLHGMINNTILHGVGENTRAPWIEAMEAQLHGIKLLDFLMDKMSYKTLKGWARASLQQWHVDRFIMGHATPFVWNQDTLAASLAASRTIPLDTKINAFNLETNAAWWYFDDAPLPIQTVSNPNAHIHAMSFGWVRHGAIEVDLKDLKVTDVVEPVGPAAFVITCWIPDPWSESEPSWRGRFGNLMPSQVWTWFDGETLQEMLDRCRREHRQQYGPGGKWHSEHIVGEDVFMHAAEVMSRFILAGFAWMNQKVLVLQDGGLPRQRRKDYQRTVSHDESTVKIIQLRRTQHVPTLDDNPEKTDRTDPYYSVRFEVDPHWRNQACGPNMSDRRLRWIDAYMKGPDDAPLHVPQRKIYVVTR